MAWRICTQCLVKKWHVSFDTGNDVCRPCQREPKLKIIRDGRAPTLAEAEQKDRPAPRPIVPVSTPVPPLPELPELELAPSLKSQFLKKEPDEPEAEIDGGRLVVKAETSVELLVAVLIAVLDVCPDARAKFEYGDLIIKAGRQRQSNQQKESTDGLEDSEGGR